MMLKTTLIVALVSSGVFGAQWSPLNSSEALGQGVDLLQQFGPYGGTGGYYFNDVAYVYGPVCGDRKITAVRVRYGDANPWGRIDNLEIVYSNSALPQPAGHGGVGGTWTQWDLDTDEGIIAVNMRTGGYVDAIQFLTSKGRISPFYGGTATTLHTVNFNGTLKYISGLASDYLDQVTFYTA